MLVASIVIVLLPDWPATVMRTVAAPEATPVGTASVTDVLLQAVGLAAMPPTVTVETLLLAPKLTPLITIVWPIAAVDGETAEIVGAEPPPTALIVIERSCVSV